MISFADGVGRARLFDGLDVEHRRIGVRRDQTGAVYNANAKRTGPTNQTILTIGVDLAGQRATMRAAMARRGLPSFGTRCGFRADHIGEHGGCKRQEREGRERNGEQALHARHGSACAESSAFFWPRIISPIHRPHRFLRFGRRPARHSTRRDESRPYETIRRSSEHSEEHLPRCSKSSESHVDDW